MRVNSMARLLGAMLAMATALSTALATGNAAAAEPKISWYGQLADGLAEAKRSNRPILLVSAAPQCEGVPGIW